MNGRASRQRSDDALMGVLAKSGFHSSARREGARRIEEVEFVGGDDWSDIMAYEPIAMAANGLDAEWRRRVSLNLLA